MGRRDAAILRRAPDLDEEGLSGSKDRSEESKAMTSYTNKLYQLAPSAARQIRRRELRDYRWGGHARNITLACFTPGNESGCAAMAAQPCNQFGQRLASPSLTAFYVKSQGYPAKVIHAADSFAARREYADHYKLPVTHVTAIERSQRSLPSR